MRKLQKCREGFCSGYLANKYIAEKKNKSRKLKPHTEIYIKKYIIRGQSKINVSAS